MVGNWIFLPAIFLTDSLLYINWTNMTSAFLYYIPLPILSPHCNTLSSYLCTCKLFFPSTKSHLTSSEKSLLTIKITPSEFFWVIQQTIFVRIYFSFPSVDSMFLKEKYCLSYFFLKPPQKQPVVGTQSGSKEIQGKGMVHMYFQLPNSFSQT